MRASYLVPLLLVSGCTFGAPPGFSSGDSWSFPLVAPLEGGPLLVPVMVHGHGPYLFQVDPDAPFSEIDAALVSELGLQGALGPEFVDESDKARNMKLAEVNHIKVGTLSIDAPHTWLVTAVGTFNTGGHQVRGLVGRDVIADSLVFGFDREAGMGWLATQKGFQKPAGATVIDTRVEKPRIKSDLLPVVRRLTHAVIDGKTRTMHVDLGAVESQLRPGLWGDTGLTEISVQRSVVDEAGTRRAVSEAGVASSVKVGGIEATNVAFLPYDDRRWEEPQLDGTIGLGALAGHAVWANWNDGNFYLAPESTATAKQRIDRWGSTELSACAAPACTTTSLLVPEEEAAPGGPTMAATGRPVMSLTRSADVADMPFEVLVVAKNTDGTASALPRFIAIFPAGETQVSLAVDPAYVGTTFEVEDVSPFPRTCPGAGACVYQLADTE